MNSKREDLQRLERADGFEKKDQSKGLYLKNSFFPFNFVVMFLLVFVFCFSFSRNARADDDNAFTQYTAVYQLNWHGISAGSSQHELTKIGPNTYSAESISKPYLSIVPFGNSERSEFTVEDSMIKPIRYDFMTEEKGKTIIGFVDFDWVKHALLKSIKDGEERNEPLTEGVLDRITYTLQLRLDLLNNKKDNLSYTVMEPKKIKHYTFHIIGDEKITTPLGTFNTVKLETVNEKGDRKTQIWLAKDLDYLLIRLVQYKDNSLDAEAILKTLKVIAPKGKNTEEASQGASKGTREMSLKEAKEIRESREPGRGPARGPHGKQDTFQDPFKNTPFKDTSTRGQ